MRIFPLLALILLPSLPLAAQEGFTTSNLPIIIIDTDDQEIQDEERIVARMGIIWNGEGHTNQVNDPYNNYNGEINIELRGSTSLVFPKKSYAFETQSVMDDVWNISLLDLPVENDWILYAPYSDRSMIRNILSYKLSRELGMYAPRTKLCELVMNDQYWGVYVLMEKIKRDKNRVDIAKLRPEEISGDDLTGGYIVKIDKQSGNSGSGWNSSFGGIYFQYEYPKHDEIVPEQKTYIQGYVDAFEQALMSEDFRDPDLGFRKYVSDSTFVDFFILNELTKNIDAYMLSTFFYKDKESKGGKLKMGPIWDFNLSLGIADYREGYKTEGFQVHINLVPWWWDRLLMDPVFIGDIRNRWFDLRHDPLSNENIRTSIDSLAVVLREAQYRNFEKWNIMGMSLWPNYYTSTSYDDEINYLKNWTLGRLQWLDQKLYDWTSSETQPFNLRTSVYPNPFTDFFQYEFALSKPGEVSLSLYDMNGKQVARILDHAFYPAGEHSVQWHAPDLQSSMYLLVISRNGKVLSRKKIVKL